MDLFADETNTIRENGTLLLVWFKLMAFFESEDVISTVFDELQLAA